MAISNHSELDSFVWPLFVDPEIGKHNDLIVICHNSYFNSIIFKIKMFGRRIGPSKKRSLENIMAQIKWKKTTTEVRKTEMEENEDKYKIETKLFGNKNMRNIQ